MVAKMDGWRKSLLICHWGSRGLGKVVSRSWKRATEVKGPKIGGGESSSDSESLPVTVEFSYGSVTVVAT